MKKLFVVTVMLSALLSKAQTPQGAAADSAKLSVEAPLMPVVGEKTFEMFDIENPPQFPGGEAALMQFIGNNLMYPDTARESNVEGLVVGTFIIDKEGKVTDITIVRDIGYGCGDELRRILMLLPRWKPGTANGYPVRVRYTLPVRFRLE